MQHQVESKNDCLNVLQPLDMNIKDTDDYPPCKRRRISNSESKKQSPEMWGLSQSNLILDELYDNGVKQLDWESDDSSNENDKSWGTTNQLSCVNDKKEFKKQTARPESSPDNQKDVSPKSISILKEANRDSCESINYFEALSDEIVLHILHWLPKCCLPTVSLVCKRFHQLSQDKCLWERMDVSCRNLDPGVLGQIISRQVIILRMAQTKVADPAICRGIKASLPDFRARLFYLDLSMASISKETLTELFSKCDRIKKLSLELVPVDDDVLLALSRNKDIEVINFAMAEGLCEEGLTYLLTNCRKLKELNLAWTHLSIACIKYVCSNLPPTLLRLNFSGCQKYMNDRHVAELVATCPLLRELDLSDCTGLTGLSVEYISALEDINFLALSRCYFIPYRSLLILRKLSALAFLDVHGGFIDGEELKFVQAALGMKVSINKFRFSSVARPTVGLKVSSIWGMRVRE